MDLVQIRRQTFAYTRTVLLLAVLGILAITWVQRTAYGADLNYNADTDIALSSPNIQLTIVSGSQATSLTVNAGDIVVTIPTGSTFTVRSPSRDLTVAGAPADTIIATECTSGGVRKVTITSQNTSNTSLTITPTDSQCSPTTSGGGGGGGTYSPPLTPTTTTIATTTQLTVATTTPDLKAQIAVLLERLAALQAQVRALGGTVSTVASGQIPKEAIPLAGAYKKPLVRGASNPDVAALQVLLKALGQKIYPEGIVSGYFGPLTQQAVQRFQLAYGVAKEGDPGFGTVGPKTRAKLNSLLSL